MIWINLLLINFWGDYPYKSDFLNIRWNIVTCSFSLGFWTAYFILGEKGGCLSLGVGNFYNLYPKHLIPPVCQPYPHIYLITAKYRSQPCTFLLDQAPSPWSIRLSEKKTILGLRQISSIEKIYTYTLLISN